MVFLALLGFLGELKELIGFGMWFSGLSDFITATKVYKNNKLSVFGRMVGYHVVFDVLLSPSISCSIWWEDFGYFCP